MREVFLPIYIYQPLGQSTPKLLFEEPLVWEIPRVVNYIFLLLAIAVAAALPSPVILVASRPSVSAPRNTLVPSIFYVSPSPPLLPCSRDLQEARQRQSKPIDATTGELLHPHSSTRCRCKFQGAPIRAEFIVAVFW